MIDVIWYKACRGNWDCGLLLSIFDKYPQHFNQINSKMVPMFNTEDSRAIVIVTGCPDEKELRQCLNNLQSGIVILTSEEDAYFDWRNAIPQNPNLELWTQYYYQQNKKPIKKRLLLGAPNRIRDYKINRDLEKKYLWSFVGQVQNPSRQQCVEVLSKLDNGLLHTALAFGGEVGGVEYQNYLDILCQTKYAICPPGSMCVDSFRLYEAIECGAVPITSYRSPRDPEDFNYWAEVHPKNKVYAVKDWNILTHMFGEDDNTFKEDQNFQSLLRDNEWWFEYKNELENTLINAANKN
jgi:hypothetical protein